MHGAEGRRQGGETGLADELGGDIGVGVQLLVGQALIRVAVLVAGHHPDLTLDGHPPIAGQRHHIAGEPDVVGVGQAGAVDHRRIEADIQTGADVVEGFPMVHMQDERSRRPAGQLDHRRPHVRDAADRLMGLGKLQDDGLTEAFADLDGGQQGLEKRGVNRCQRRVVLLGVVERRA